MRIALAKFLMVTPDILYLMNLQTIWILKLEHGWIFFTELQRWLLLVSHDRYFLDVNNHEVNELFSGDLKRYPGNFTHYEKVRAEELKTLIAAYEKQQEEMPT